MQTITILEYPEKKLPPPFITMKILMQIFYSLVREENPVGFLTGQTVHVLSRLLDITHCL